VHAAEAAQVEGPEIHAGIARGDPVAIASPARPKPRCRGEAAGDEEIVDVFAMPITGSPSADTGIGPLMTVRMPTSLRTGIRSAQDRQSRRGDRDFAETAPAEIHRELAEPVDGDRAALPAAIASAPGSDFK